MNAKMTAAEQLAQAFERVLTEHTERASGWINIRSTEWPWRRMVAAAERGELTIARVGRKLLVRRADLDAWLEAQAIQARVRKPRPEPTAPSSRIAHMLAGHERTVTVAVQPQVRETLSTEHDNRHKITVKPGKNRKTPV